MAKASELNRYRSDPSSSSAQAKTNAPPEMPRPRVPDVRNAPMDQYTRANSQCLGLPPFCFIILCLLSRQQLYNIFAHARIMCTGNPRRSIERKSYVLDISPHAFVSITYNTCIICLFLGSRTARITSPHRMTCRGESFERVIRD